MPHSSQRTIVSIGDLHGDYRKAERLLLEQGVLLPPGASDSLQVNPACKRTDLVFIGDYVDWRGETLEGEADSRGILDLVFRLHREWKSLRQSDPDFSSQLYPLVGNHDEMMVDAHAALQNISTEALVEVLQQAGRRLGRAIRACVELGLSEEASEAALCVFKWHSQGGESTVESFGGMEAWKTAMDGSLGDFLRNDLLLGVVLNHRLYTHTAPDNPEYWKPLHEILALPAAEYQRAREAYLWSRRVWGYDWQTGYQTSPLTQEEVEAMVAGMGVEGLVIGHTRVSTDGRPVLAFRDRIVNIDLHGVPGSGALVERYVNQPA